MARVKLGAAELAGAEEVTEDLPGKLPAKSPPKRVKLSPEELAGAEEAPEPGFIDKAKGAARVAATGMTLGLADEGEAAGSALLKSFASALSRGEVPSSAEVKKFYLQERDRQRGKTEEARKDLGEPAALAFEVAGGLLTPLPGGAAKAGANVAKAAGLGRKALAAVKGLAPAAATGAVAGVGYQESAPGELASAEELVDAGVTGAATSAAVTGGLRAGAAAVRGAAKASGQLARRITGQAADAVLPDNARAKKQLLDMVARHEPGQSATMTKKKHLEKAADALFDEVTKGPDAKAVLRAITGPAERGRAELRPIINDAGKKSQRLYDRFTRAGKDVVDMKAYAGSLKRMELEARREGNARMADGLRAVRERMLLEAEETIEAEGQTTIRWLRSHTTTMQDAAASKIGGLNEHETARVAQMVAARAKTALDEVLDSAAEGNPFLKKTATQIRKNNRRLYALLTADDVLSSRLVKEQTGKGGFESFGEKVKSTVAGGTLGAVAGGGMAALEDENQAMKVLGGAAAGAALGRAPALGRRLDRYLTTEAITRLQRAAQKGSGASEAIKNIARDASLPERIVRAAYIRLMRTDERR